MNSTTILSEGLERLLKSNLLTSGREIRSYLISLAEDKELSEILKTACNDFSFDEELNRAFIEGQGLPKHDGRAVAFFTRLLFLIDIGQIPLADLLSGIYPDKQGSEAYSSFLSDYVLPYGESFAKLLLGEPIEDVPEPQKPIYDKMNEDVCAMVDRMAEEVTASPLPSEVIKDILDAINGLKYALSFSDALLTKIAYRGLINTLRLYGTNVEKTEALESALKLYGVL